MFIFVDVYFLAQSASLLISNLLSQFGRYVCRKLQKLVMNYLWKFHNEIVCLWMWGNWHCTRRCKLYHLQKWNMSLKPTILSLLNMSDPTRWVVLLMKNGKTSSKVTSRKQRRVTPRVLARGFRVPTGKMPVCFEIVRCIRIRDRSYTLERNSSIQYSRGLSERFACNISEGVRLWMNASFCIKWPAKNLGCFILQ